uniref:Uncharacterized protein n=1 Tax=Triticum urartu TaxID=4572 RepID=A0A8R7URG3_TRIUA
MMQTSGEDTKKFFKQSSVICVLSHRYPRSKVDMAKQKRAGGGHAVRAQPEEHPRRHAGVRGHPPDHGFSGRPRPRRWPIRHPGPPALRGPRHRLPGGHPQPHARRRRRGERAPSAVARHALPPRRRRRVRRPQELRAAVAEGDGQALEGVQAREGRCPAEAPAHPL